MYIYDYKGIRMSADMKNRQPMLTFAGFSVGGD